MHQILPLKLFIGSYFVSLISLIIAYQYFNGFQLIATSGLIAIALTSTMQNLLESNRILIWEKHISPWKANWILAKDFFLIFTSVFLATVSIKLFHQALTPQEAANISQAYDNTFSFLFSYNLQVLLGCLVLGSIYGAGGLMLVLAWNGTVWANTLYDYVSTISNETGYFSASIFSLSLLPHLTLELFAYVLSGLSGIFVVKAIRKYKLTEPAFSRVLIACFVILIVSTTLLFLSVISEIYLAQPVFKDLTKSIKV